MKRPPRANVGIITYLIALSSATASIFKVSIKYGQNINEEL